MTTATLRLLHIEDNPADALLMQEFITESCRHWNMSLPHDAVQDPAGAQYQVEFDTAERLADVTTARASAADCAILDLSLPDASGLDALVALRAMSQDLPIVVLTGFDDLEVGLSALRCGADDYLVKSQIDGFTLDRAVRYSIARRRLATDQAVAAAAATVTAVADLLARTASDEQVRAIGAEGQPVRQPRRSESAPAPGTHQVMVQIDAVQGEYTLECQTCSWSAPRGEDARHSWSERSLDAVLLQHLTFGQEARSA